MTLEFVAQSLLKFLAEYVDTSSRQFVVQIRDDKIQGHLYFNMHFGRCRFRSLYSLYTLTHTHTHTQTQTHTHTHKLISSLPHSLRFVIFFYCFLLVITFCFLWVGLVVVVVGGGIILAAIRVCVYFSICVAQCSTVPSILNTFIEIFGLLFLCCIYTYIYYLYICLHMYISMRI